MLSGGCSGVNILFHNDLRNDMTLLLRIFVLLATTLPVAPIVAQPVDYSADREHFLPLIVDGAGFQSRLFLANVSDTENHCTLTLRGPSLNDSFFEAHHQATREETGTVINFSAAGTDVILTSAGADALSFGYMMLDCEEPVVARILLSLEIGESLISPTTIEGADIGYSFHFPALPRLGRLAMVFSSNADLDANCAVELDEWESIGGGSLNIPSNTTILAFLDELIPLPSGFEAGAVHIQCDQEVAALGILLNNTVLTAIPAVPLDGEVARSSHTLPLIQDGDGFRSRLMLTNLANGSNSCNINLIGKGFGADRFEAPSVVSATDSAITVEFSEKGENTTLTSLGMQSLAWGYAKVECDGPTAVRNLLAMETERGELAGMAIVAGTQSAAEMLFPVAPKPYRLALVLSNDSDSASSCSVELPVNTGAVYGSEPIVIASHSTAIQFLHDLLSLPNDFMGDVAKLTCDRRVLAVSLPFGGAGFAAMPPAVINLPLLDIHGTLFVDPDIITPKDPSVFESISYAGKGRRMMFDRRVADWVELEPFLFDVTYLDGFTLEIQVNPEFGTEAAALVEAERYGWLIGQMPRVLRGPDFQTVWIHRGNELWGGGNNNILIHTDSAADYERRGIIEEVFLHEGTHTSLDTYHLASAGWLAAQAADGDFISAYASEFPNREDLAETFPMWFALRFREDRISARLANTIRRRIPNRLEYLDAQDFNLSPAVSAPASNPE